MWTTLPRSKHNNKLSAYQAGAGPHLLLVHGVGMNADYWSNITPALERLFSLTVVDMPGHGHSPLISHVAKSNTPALQDYSDVIASALPADVPTIIVGHSMGALIALDMAVRHPQQIAGIAVLNGVHRRSDKSQQAILARANELSTNTAPDPGPTLQRWFGTSPTGIDAEAAICCRQWLQNANHQGYADAYRIFAASDSPADRDLQLIHCPALFMTGSDEPNSTPQMSQSMSNQVVNSRCVIATGARHMMSMTHGKQVVDELVATFVSQQDGV